MSYFANLEVAESGTKFVKKFAFVYICLPGRKDIPHICYRRPLVRRPAMHPVQHLINLSDPEKWILHLFETENAIFK
jgi:hypothetical protein